MALKEVLAWLVRWACRAGTRNVCPALAALVGPVQKFFSSPYAISVLICPHRPSKLGGQAVLLSRPSLSMCPWRRHCNRLSDVTKDRKLRVKNRNSR